MYTMDRYEQRANPGNKAMVECSCAGCKQPIGDSPLIVVRTWQTTCMPAPAFNYFHPACNPNGENHVS
jgi:hypothetical protein